MVPKVSQFPSHSTRVCCHICWLFPRLLQGWYKWNTRLSILFCHTLLASNLHFLFVMFYRRIHIGILLVRSSWYWHLFLTLFCQPYKEQFKVYCLSDAIMLQSAACLFIMISAANVADIKAVHLNILSYCLVWNCCHDSTNLCYHTLHMVDTDKEEDWSKNHCQDTITYKSEPRESRAKWFWERAWSFTEPPKIIAC